MNQRISSLEAHVSLLKQQKTELELKNEELVASQSRVLELEARLQEALKQVDELQAEIHVVESAQCPRCGELEKQQAEIACDFVELQKLCQRLCSTISEQPIGEPLASKLDDAVFPPARRSPPVRSAALPTEPLKEEPRLRLGSRALGDFELSMKIAVPRPRSTRSLSYARHHDPPKAKSHACPRSSPSRRSAEADPQCQRQGPSTDRKTSSSAEGAT